MFVRHSYLSFGIAGRASLRQCDGWVSWRRSLWRSLIKLHCFFLICSDYFISIWRHFSGGKKIYYENTIPIHLIIWCIWNVYNVYLKHHQLTSLSAERAWSVSAQVSDGMCAYEVTSWWISSCLWTGEWPQRWVALAVCSVSSSVWQVEAEAANTYKQNSFYAWTVMGRDSLVVTLLLCRCLKTHPSFSLFLHCFGFSWLK